MLLDSIHGIISRRVLLNFRIDPEVISKVLPSPFRPKLYAGHAIGGVCMIRFSGLRPRGAPSLFGMSSENAAHQIAVEWEDKGKKMEGVYIPQRNTGSRFNKALGGKVFPGLFSLSGFEVSETDQAVSIRITNRDGIEEVSFCGETAAEHSKSSIFPTLDFNP